MSESQPQPAAAPKVYRMTVEGGVIGVTHPDPQPQPQFDGDGAGAEEAKPDDQGPVNDGR